MNKTIEEKVLNEPIVYEVIRLINKEPLFLKDHLNRLESSIKFYTDKKMDVSGLKTLMKKVIDINQLSNHNIRIEVGNLTTNLDYIVRPSISQYPTLDAYKNGVHTITLEKLRKNPLIKEKNQSFKKYVKNKLQEHNAFECILMDENTRVLEGSRSNFFIIKDHRVITSKKGEALEGITLKNVLKVVRASGYDYKRKDMYLEDLKNADAAFLTGTSIDILPIASINNINLKSSMNPIVMDLINKFNNYKIKDLRGMSWH